MAVITLVGFLGANVATSPRLLAENVGVHVVDADPGRGDLRPIRDRVTVATVPTSPQRRSIYRMGRDTPNDAKYWLSSSAIVNYARGFDSSDTSERTYFTGDGTPKWTDNIKALGGGPSYPQAVRELAVPAPTVAATVGIVTNGTSGTESEIFFVHTFVNDIGWESAPSPISTGVLCKPGSTLSISNLPAAPAGAYAITTRRIYRTQAGATGEAEFFFHSEIPIGATSTTDTGQKLGDVMPVGGMIPPPAGAFGMIALWSGIYSVLSPDGVHLSEPGLAYAYPARYDIATKGKPVANAKWEQCYLVLTTAEAVLIQGQDPSSMSDMELRNVWPCAAARGVVSMGDGAVWPSNEGLASTYSDKLLTEDIVTPAQWKAMVPSSIVAGRYGRLYVASYDDGAGRKGFMFDPKSPTGIWYLSSGFDACHYDELADALYVLEGGNVRRFDAGALLTASFTSKVFRQTPPQNYSHAQVVADSYPVPVTFTAKWVDERGQPRTVLQTRIALSGEAFTLRSGFMADDWQIQVASSDNLQAVRLATNVHELNAA